MKADAKRLAILDPRCVNGAFDVRFSGGVRLGVVGTAARRLNWPSLCVQTDLSTQKSRPGGASQNSLKSCSRIPRMLLAKSSALCVDPETTNTKSIQ